MAAFWAGTEMIVPRHEHIAVGGYGFAPAAGGAAVVARWGRDGHSIISLNSLLIQYNIFDSNWKILSMNKAFDNFFDTVDQYGKHPADLGKLGKGCFHNPDGGKFHHLYPATR